MLACNVFSWPYCSLTGPFLAVLIPGTTIVRSVLPFRQLPGYKQPLVSLGLNLLVSSLSDRFLPVYDTAVIGVAVDDYICA